jgi:DNA-binding CsgD family transcriptional regulator
MPDHVLEAARQSYEGRSWRTAYDSFAAAAVEAPLGLDDLERAARAAQLIGLEPEACELWQRAVQAGERTGENERAARCACWLGMALMYQGDFARAGGWYARARRLVEDEPDSVVHGFVMVPTALQALFGGDAATAYPIFVEALAIAERCRDVDATTLSRLGVGQSLLRLGSVAEGLTMLDDAMVAVTADEVTPIVAGIVYCATIEACHALCDVRRAREWTEALTRWCAAQPDIVPFRGQCLAHRAEILRLGGAWVDAMHEAERACDHLQQAHDPAIGEALYQKAELHRLQGDLALAEAAYRATSECGRDPQPGLALLRVAQGDVGAGEAAIRRTLAECGDPIERARLLAAFVEIALAAHDVTSARASAEELARIAGASVAPYLHALSAYATGAVSLAEGDPRAATASLRRAWTGWCDVDAPYEAAGARVLIGIACRELGDHDSAALEFDAARRAFEAVGALPDLDRLDRLTARAKGFGGLTGREVEVLELVAAGKTNRQIAGELVISEKTVARHVSNIFTKLGVSSRAAATAFAVEHDIA